MRYTTYAELDSAHGNIPLEHSAIGKVAVKGSSDIPTYMPSRF